MACTTDSEANTLWALQKSIKVHLLAGGDRGRELTVHRCRVIHLKDDKHYHNMLLLPLELLPLHSRWGHASVKLSPSSFGETLFTHRITVRRKKLGAYLCTTTFSPTTITTILLCVKLLSPHSRKSINSSFKIIYPDLLVEHHHSHPKIALHERHNSTLETLKTHL